MPTVRRLLTQVIDVPAGNLYPEGTILVSNTGIVDASIGTALGANVIVTYIDGGNASGGGGVEEQPPANNSSNTTVTGLSTRTIVSSSVGTIAANSIADVNISGFKSYALYTVGYTQPAWIRIYTSAAARANDTNRAIGADPVPGSGILAEVVTTANSQSFILTPPVVGFNSEAPVGNTVYVSIKNTSNTTLSSGTIALTLLQTEA